jgi:GTP pyrophosphokinase
VKGIDDILVRFGKCCQPVPGDEIIGYITRGHGVTVHRVNCVNALKMNPDRKIDTEWSDNSTGTYPVKIHIRSYDRVGLLADLASNITKSGANIVNVHSESLDDNTVDSIFTLAVKDTEHLKKVLTAIKKVRMITKVKRIDA